MVENLLLICSVRKTVNHFFVQTKIWDSEVFKFWCWIALRWRGPHVIEPGLSPIKTCPSIKHLILVSAKVRNEVIHWMIFSRAFLRSVVAT